MLQLFDIDKYTSLEYTLFSKGICKISRAYRAIPFQKIIEALPVELKKENSRGPKAKLDLRAGLGLMFLKHLTGLSDADLVESLNADYRYQFFCGIRLKPTERINDLDAVGYWRRKLAPYIKDGYWEQIQEVLASAWKSDMDDTKTCFTDATCYESYVRYPTDVKIVWECCDNIKKILDKSGQAKGMKPLTKYFEKQSVMYMGYAKSRKKTYKKTKNVKRRLLILLNKLIEYLELRKKSDKSTIYLTMRQINRFEVIKKVYEQQILLQEDPECKIEERIVSLAKPYLRPIVRGKETKRVEFGAKLNKLQVDGIGFVEHINFNAFHEGKRLKSTIFLHRRLFGVCHRIAADAIYANNENRSYCSENEIYTNFIPKGRRSNSEKATQVTQLRSLLSKERATTLEGSFGTEKEHYNLKLIKAKREDTELLWICFGIWTFSAMKIAKRMDKKSKLKHTG